MVHAQYTLMLFFFFFLNRGKAPKDLDTAFHPQRWVTNYMEVQKRIEITTRTYSFTERTLEPKTEKQLSPSPPRRGIALAILASIDDSGDEPLGIPAPEIARMENTRGLRIGITPGG